MEWLKEWRTSAAWWIAAVILLAALAYFVDGNHATFGLALKDEFTSEAVSSVVGLAVIAVLGLTAYLMFETSVAANAAVILLCAAWLLKLYFFG